jgi:hypothetical protein
MYNFALPDKTPTEQVTVTFPFATEFPPGTTLTSLGVSKALIDGDDAGAALLTVGTPQVQQTNLLVLVQIGKDANTYGVLATVSGSDGEVRQLGARIRVTVDAT